MRIENVQPQGKAFGGVRVRRAFPVYRNKRIRKFHTEAAV
jgi:hypothetical protein